MKRNLILLLLFALSLGQSIDTMPELVLYCSNTDCHSTKLKELYSVIVVNSSLVAAGLYSIGVGFRSKNEEPLVDYENLKRLPQGFQLTEKLLDELKVSHYNSTIILGVVNGSMAEHREFFAGLMSVFPNAGYLDTDRYFELAVSFEVYRRHCPTIIAYNPESGELWLTYIKFSGNRTVDVPKIEKLLKDLKEEKIKSVKQGFSNILTKFTNWNYFFNNFHSMGNYVLGIISVLYAIGILFFEDQAFSFIKGNKPAPKSTASNKKNE